MNCSVQLPGGVYTEDGASICSEVHSYRTRSNSYKLKQGSHMDIGKIILLRVAKPGQVPTEAVRYSPLEIFKMHRT